MQANVQSAAKPDNYTAPELSDAIDLGLIDPSAARFGETAGGFLELTYKDKNYPRVSVRRTLPLGMPYEYLSIADEENHEIGILRKLADLDGDQRRLVEKELERRYYCPNVVEVRSVKDQLGYVYIDISIQGTGDITRRTCAIKDVNRNIRMLSDDSVILFDVDGNRYMIPSLKALSAKSRRRLEPYLF
ncbi:MAG: DUF1854 domain-containing protein [Oscillospiraceae bacterium]|jgi:hypothetical protein|nr:DUF1854 domain-containing protein [Oscillospiraceae bacterium]